MQSSTRWTRRWPREGNGRVGSDVKVIRALDVVPRIGTNYPGGLGAPCNTREKRTLGDQFGLTQFGVNLTILPPGVWSSLRHWHEREDELVYIIEGEATLVDDSGEYTLSAGMSAGFKAGVENGHHLVNRSTKPVTYIEVGTRALEDNVTYPGIDLRTIKRNGGPWQGQHRDGTPY